LQRLIRFEARHPADDDLPPGWYSSLAELYERIRARFTGDDLVSVAAQVPLVDDRGKPLELPSRPPIGSTVSSLADVARLIDAIITEGEGAARVDPSSHWSRLREMRRELRAELEADPTFAPARPVAANPSPHVSDAPAYATYVAVEQDDGLQRTLLDLFDGAYGVMLSWLEHLFCGRGTPAERHAVETLLYAAHMTEVIAPLAEILTLVPADLSRPDGACLGAPFDASTIATDGIPASIDRLRGLRADAGRAIAILGHRMPDSPALGRLRFVEQTLRLMADELESRIANGWPPRPTVADDHAFSELATGLWVATPSPPVLDLTFEGWVQLRLATYPDSAGAPRGAIGNTAAIGDEPDLDRVLRLQPPGTVPRSHAPPIGVRVVAARLLRSPHHAAASGIDVPALVGASVDLLGDPKFEGRNHLVSSPGEPIDPFQLSIESADGTLQLRRRARGIAMIDMTPTQRRGTGRYAVAAARTLATIRRNLLLTKVSAGDEYLAERRRVLEAELAQMVDVSGPAYSALAARVAWLRGGTPWHVFLERLEYRADYLHTLSGPMEVRLDGVRAAFAVATPDGDPARDDRSKWVVDYHFGFYDTDAMAAYMNGIVRIPVVLG
jgi:hypothetical protein